MLVTYYNHCTAITSTLLTELFIVNIIIHRYSVPIDIIIIKKLS